jgi:hypothetical protein
MTAENNVIEPPAEKTHFACDDLVAEASRLRFLS